MVRRVDGRWEGGEKGEGRGGDETATKCERWWREMGMKASSCWSIAVTDTFEKTSRILVFFYKCS